ncbi:MAG: hypothetical protein M1821_004051 [Bathelium mastoideum]|nr:MAG: hypothetical protein M1821_004051 [Bathelium mastoideum]KAI9691123.1 MAG: hypothetical protein M1822_008743 [Bathelium mastoideum]
MQYSLILASLAALAAAKTDIAGCTSSATRDQYGEASMIYWVPGSGEICAFLDCGGGMAPPKYNVPGCAAYTGTASYSPSYLPGYGPGATSTPAAQASSSAAAPSVTAPASYAASTSSYASVASSYESSVLSSASAVISSYSSLISSAVYNTTLASVTSRPVQSGPAGNGSAPYPTTASPVAPTYGSGSGSNSSASSTPSVVPANPNGAAGVRPMAVLGGVAAIALGAATLL